MKTTKPFLLATAGSTVDGREIDDAMLEEMASSYNPKTYAARLNIEHIRGISGEGPFRAYGDVVSLSTGDVEIDFNGTKETRKGLFGVLSVNDDAIRLNEAGQKLYPSIEIQTNFAGKGFAYCIGAALTDSPAAIGTERMEFNRSTPGALTVTAKKDALLEFADDAPTSEEASGVIAKFFTDLGEKLGLGTAPSGGTPTPTATPPSEPGGSKPAPQNFDMAAFTAGLETALTKGFAAHSQAVDTKIEALSHKVDQMAATIETTPAPNQPKRPLANGPNGENYNAEF